MEENRCQEIFDRGSATLYLRRQRATNLRDNPRVHLPTPRPRREKIIMEAKEVYWEETIDLYRQDKCDQKGYPLEDNLNPAQRRGKKSLDKKRKDCAIVVSQTDKSGKLTVSTPANYVQQGLKHVQGDKKVSWKEVIKIKNLVKCHTRAIANIFR